ncbi:MAG: YvcK family protein [Candidatus Omnitrophica bacterium]|nr:YvcK family protein [Candidatus Omnitrophota bacterium]
MKKFFKFIRWFYPGLRIKRWVIVLVIGLLLLLGSSSSSKDILLWKIVNTFIFILGAGALITGTAFLIKSFIEVIYPHKEKGLIDIIYEKRFLAKGPKIVAIGGGTGLSTILEGLKSYTSNISAIVAVADEGGSSGRIREEFGILPPGDIRNCLVSLSDSPQLMRDLFQYRFKEGGGMKGHSFGNLFITALTEVTGSFKDAVEESSKVLAIRGRVIPSSLDEIRLKAEYRDGTTQDGEDKIPDVAKPIKKIFLMPSDAQPNPEALDAIREAEMIVFGPGSLFTSIIPNLLIKEISDEIVKRDVLKVYICNVMTQHGETDGFTSADHLSMFMEHVDKGVVNCCLVNSGGLKHKLLFKYAQEGSFPVIFDRERLKRMGVTVFDGDVVSKSNYLRHDSEKVGKKIVNIYNEWKKTWKE